MSSFAKLKHFPVYCILVLTGIVQTIKIKEEYSGKNQRYVSMDEIEEKSRYYLRHHKHIGDDDIVNEKVKIMGDRFQELYREHGLDAIHDIFEHVDDLELAIGREDRWQAYMAGLVYPKPPQEWRYARHLLAGLMATFITAVVMATPFSFKYAKRFLKGSTFDKHDAELIGADSYAEVMIRRIKKRTRKVFYKPMLPSFNLNTESNRTSEAELKEAEEKLRLWILREAEFKEKKKREKEERMREVRLAMERRKRILLDDDPSDEEFEDQRSTGSSLGQDRTSRIRGKVVVIPKNLKKFRNRKAPVLKCKKKL